MAKYKISIHNATITVTREDGYKHTYEFDSYKIAFDTINDYFNQKYLALSTQRLACSGKERHKIDKQMQKYEILMYKMCHALDTTRFTGNKIIITFQS